MLGARSGSQDRLFYAFDLDAVVPRNHLLRKVDAVLELDWLRAGLAPYYSLTGRPSGCPELMIRMLLVGYCFGIRSERRLREEARLNLAYRWFCRLGIEDAAPDHSTFSVNRHGRFRDSDILRTVFEEVVRRCMAPGLVGRGICGRRQRHRGGREPLQAGRGNRDRVDGWRAVALACARVSGGARRRCLTDQP